MEQVASEFDAVLMEAENWTDGVLVDSEDQLTALDAVLKQFKTYKSALTKAGKEHTTPAHTAWKETVADVKKYTDDADTIQKALVAAGDPFRKKLAAEKEAAKRAAYEEANRLEREAAAKLAEANAASIEEQREAQAAQDAALEAKKAAQSANKDTVKGMRKVTKYSIENHKAALHWIAINDKEAMTAFIDEYVRRNHKTTAIDGVRVWEEKESF
jgi:hypothetical protein